MIFFLFIFKNLAYYECQYDEHCLECYYSSCNKCEDGYAYEYSEGCLPCHETCKQCYYSKYASYCTECYDGFYLNKNYDWNSYGSCISCSNDGLCAKCDQDSPHYCTQCIFGYYLNRNVNPPKCESCHSTCETCSGPNEDQCITCSEGYYKTADNKCKPCGSNCKKCENENKCTICQDHYYTDSSSQCQKCDDTCKSCHGSTLNDCDECYDGYYNGNGLCRACDPNCNTCIATRNHCTSCEEGKYLDQEKHICLTCDASCKECKSADYCTVCADGYYKGKYDDLCSSCNDGSNCQTCFFYDYYSEVLCSTCKPGYYSSPIYGTNGVYCYKSGDQGCFNATDYSTCVKCFDGYFLSGSKCIKCDDSCLTCENSNSCSACSHGFYLDEKTHFCTKCSQNCADCSSGTKCNECNDKYYVSDGFCKECDPSCQRCHDNTNACIQCSAGYYFNQFKRCVKCGPNCDICTDDTHCIDCASEFFLLPNGTCSACADVCFECSGPTSDDCIECDPGYYLSSSFKKCFKCNDACSKCTGPNNDECSECSPGYFLKSSTCVKCETGCKNCTSITNCVGCQDGYYLNNANCEHCSQGCKSCTSIDHCTQCFDGFYPIPGQDGTVNCTTRCPEGCESCTVTSSGQSECKKCFDGYYLNGKQCSRCSSPCATCKSQNVCTSCIKGHLLDSSSSCNSLCSPECASCEKTPNTCTSCPDGYILNGTVCIKCPTNCKICEIEGGKSVCSTCLDGFYLAGDECLRCHSSCATCRDQWSDGCYECKEGYFKYKPDNYNVGYCYQCDYSYYGTSNCAKCTSDCTVSSYCDFQCTECSNGYYLSNNQCLICHSTCKTCDGPTDQNCVERNDGFYLNEGKCLKCDESCVTCDKSSTNCTSCQSHYYLSNGKCTECSDLCVECTDSNTCTQCPQYQFLHEGKCLKSCLQIGDGWGANNKYECVKCDLDNCKSYDDACQCTECNKGYYIVSDPVTLIEICLPCQLDNCKACNGPEINDCIECNDGYELQTNQYTKEKTCVSLCPDGYFVNVNNKCEKCRSPCKSCSGIDGSICNQCEDGYFTNGTSCSVLPNDCVIFKHCENENKGEKPVHITLDITSFNSFRNENGGGALRLINCGLSGENATFNECRSEEGGGGAIYILNDKNNDYSISLKDLTFTSCHAAFGGAIYIYSIADFSPVVIESCNFYYNDIINSTDGSSRNRQFNGGSALYLTVKNGSVNDCYIKSRSSFNVIKTTNNFNIQPEELKMLENHVNTEFSTNSITFTGCSLENDNEPSLIYFVERQTSDSDLSVKIKSKDFPGQIKGELNNSFIIFENDINENKRETTVVLSYSLKCLLSLCSFGLIAIIITIIVTYRINHTKDSDDKLNSNSIDSFNE